MNFIEELRWRGMLHDMTPGAEEFIQSKKVTGYIGFDPTAPSMTIGNYVQLMILTLFQKAGHSPIVLMGGATGRVGDPSFKETERDLKTYEELDKNLSFQMEQVKKILDFEGPNPAKIVNNLDFYKNMNILEFLRDVGKTLTVNYMMSKDSVKNRLETGLSFTEFSYQLLQAYDFQLLYQNHDCHLQMGGSDQWGNITSGTEFIRRNTDGKAYAVTTPLLTKADGTKFGKSEQGNIWLDPNLTSPYQFYQFWINADDRDISKYLRYFSLKSHEEIEALEAMIPTDPRAVKAALAEEITARIHSPGVTADIIKDTALSRSDITKLSFSEFENLVNSIPTIQGGEFIITKKISIYDEYFVGLMHEGFGFKSKSEFRRAIEGKSIYINKVLITDINHSISKSDLLHGKYLFIEFGKKRKLILDLYNWRF